jgi:hypothetical protein
MHLKLHATGLRPGRGDHGEEAVPELLLFPLFGPGHSHDDQSSL